MTERLRDIIDAIVEGAPALRAAGVRRLRIGDVSVRLAPLPEPIVEEGRYQRGVPSDPLMDPTTYGADPRNPEARIPTYLRPPPMDEV